MSGRSARRTTQTAPPSTPRGAAVLPTLIVALAGLAAYGAVSSTAVINGRLEFEEAGALIKAWWYITGTVPAFSASDAALIMPGFPFTLGALQKAIGLSVDAARIAMAAMGLVTSALLFLLCRKLTGNMLASVAAVMVFLAAPATSYGFSTATPVALTALLLVCGLWVLVLGLGRPRAWLTAVMGFLLTAIVLTSSEMLIPAVLFAVLFIAAAGRARFVHTMILLATVCALIGAAIYVLPAQFTTFLLYQPVPLMVLNAAGLVPIGAPALPSYDTVRIVQDAIDGFVLPYSGTLVLCVVLFVLTLKGPRVLWVIPFYVIAAALALIVFRPSACETCAATLPSQIMPVASIGVAMALAFLGRWRRQNQGAAAPVIIGATAFALALNTFAPSVATRPALQFFPMDMVKQARPAAEKQEIAALMRVIGEHVPGNERALLLHRLPSLPYAVHMAGRRFPVISLNPLAGLRALPATVTGAQREAMLGVIERGGGWTGETLRRWIQRDYDMIILQDGILALDQITTETLAEDFDLVTTADFRGARLVFYKRKI